jgi:8-amino-3,8-dideoxy-alpha-D-manno-octulosonate transaminase
MNPESLRDCISEKTKVVIPVHMSGVACDMKKIKRVVEECGTNIKILEDNAQSPGGTYRGKFLGTIGEVGIFSFDYGKMLTTGEGGMIVTNDENIYKTVRSLSDHGHAFNPAVPRGLDDCIGLGFNYKMNEVQGAIGLVQLSKLQKTIDAHKKNKQLFLENLKDTVELRSRPDPFGDIGVSVSFFCNGFDKTMDFLRKWTEKGYTTYNLPDAAKWHVATYWKHINFRSKGLFESGNTLTRTIAIPVRAKMEESEIIKQTETIKEIVNGRK